MLNSSLNPHLPYRENLPGPRIGNPLRLSALVSLGVSIGGVGLIILPMILNIEGMGGGFALMFVGFFITLTGLVVAGLFYRQSRVLKRIIANAAFLAHWVYQPAEWQVFTMEEFERQKSANRIKWLIIAFFSVVVGAGFMLFAEDKEAAQAVVGILSGMLVLLAGLAWGIPLLVRSRNRRIRSSEVWIASSLSEREPKKSKRARLKV